MNDLEERILDRLVGTRIGVSWPDGFLAIAADAVGGKTPVRFGQTDTDRGAKSEIARRLGYPILLCEALQGATRGLTEENDRCKFAVSVFGSVPVGGKLGKLSVAAQNRVAASIAIRAHRYVCAIPECPVTRVLGDLLLPLPLDTAAFAVRCATLDMPIGFPMWRLSAGITREELVMQTAAKTIRGVRIRKSESVWGSIRESARLAASERGVDEAVACCREISRQCGLGPRGA